MANLDESIGVCDLCGKEADARFEDCHSLYCTAGCHREQGDLYHADCLKKFIGAGSRGTAKHLPSIPYSNFLCPKGKGKGSQPEVPCKGLAHHCKRIVVKAEKAPPPQVLPEKRPKPQPKPAIKQSVPQKPAKPKAPPTQDFNPRARLPPMPDGPKPDPLGRNLNGKTQQELPPGYVEEAEAAAEKARQAKSAKKNKKRAAKRKDEGGSQWDASSINGSTGLPPLEEVASQASFGGDTSGAAGDEGSVASAGRYITSISAYHALLSKHLDLSDDSEYEYDSEDESTHVAESATPIPQWHHQQQQEQQDDDPTGWQAVGGKGKAVPAAVPPVPLQGGCSSRGEGGAGGTSVVSRGEDPEELRRREEELLNAALQASLADAAPAAAAATAGEDDFTASLQRAMQESLAAEEAQRQREREEQAALLAAFGQRQQEARQDPGAAAGQTAMPGWSATAAAVPDSGDAWGSVGSTDSAATAWGVSQGTPQAVPYQQEQQYTSNPYAAAPAAVPAAAPAPAYVTYTLPQAAYAASATPTPLAATVSAPTATTTAAAYQPAAVQQQQQQAPVPWLQPAAASAPAAAGGYPGMAAAPAAAPPVGYAAVPAAAGVGYTAAAPAAAVDDDDCDLDDLLALLNV